MLSAVSEESHRIVLYRRQMARVGCALAERLRAAALVTGDSLGQVSSQTLPNMTSVEEAAELPVLRPLLTWDKREVMAKAAELGILSLSELPAEDACPLFAGGKQRTAVPRARLVDAEAQLDLAGAGPESAANARRGRAGHLPGALERDAAGLGRSNSLAAAARRLDDRLGVVEAFPGPELPRLVHRGPSIGPAPGRSGARSRRRGRTASPA